MILFSPLIYNINCNDHVSDDMHDAIYNLPDALIRKPRQSITKNLAEWGLLTREISLVEIANVLHISNSTAKRLYKKISQDNFQIYQFLSFQARKKVLIRKTSSLKKI